MWILPSKRGRQEGKRKICGYFLAREGRKREKHSAPAACHQPQQLPDSCASFPTWVSLLPLPSLSMDTSLKQESGSHTPLPDDRPSTSVSSSMFLLNTIFLCSGEQSLKARKKVLPKRGKEIRQKREGETLQLPQPSRSCTCLGPRYLAVS